MDVEQRLQAILRTKLKEDIGPSTKLADAGLDSLDVIEVAFDIEDKFKVQLPHVGGEMISFTYGDLLHLVEQQLAASNDTALPASKALWPARGME